MMKVRSGQDKKSQMNIFSVHDNLLIEARFIPKHELMLLLSPKHLVLFVPPLMVQHHLSFSYLQLGLFFLLLHLHLQLMLQLFLVLCIIIALSYHSLIPRDLGLISIIDMRQCRFPIKKLSTIYPILRIWRMFPLWVDFIIILKRYTLFVFQRCRYIYPMKFQPFLIFLRRLIHQMIASFIMRFLNCLFRHLFISAACRNRQILIIRVIETYPLALIILILMAVFIISCITITPHFNRIGIFYWVCLLVIIIEFLVGIIYRFIIFCSSIHFSDICQSPLMQLQFLLAMKLHINFISQLLFLLSFFLPLHLFFILFFKIELSHDFLLDLKRSFLINLLFYVLSINTLQQSI